MKRLFWLLAPALLCPVLLTIVATPQVALARESDDRVVSLSVSHLGGDVTPFLGIGDVPQGRPREQAPPPDSERIRRDFRQRHDADAFVPRLAGSIRVLARLPWTDSRITVRAGQRVSFQSVGTVFFSLDEGATAGPGGIDNGRANRREFPVRELGVCGLIGRVGNGAPFPVGSGAGPIVMPASGRLYLGINDSQFNDNSGFFRVKPQIR